MATRFAPFRDVDLMARSLLTPQLTSPGSAATAPMDAVRTTDGLELSFDLPGVDPATIDLTAEGNVVTLTAQRSRQVGEDDRVLVAERPRGAVRRQLRLGDGLDLAGVSASFEHGVLTVRVPAAATARPNKIDIEVVNNPALDAAAVDATAEVEAPASEVD